MLALAIALLAQVQALQVTTELERPRVTVGEEFSFTLRAIGHGTAPFRVELPPLDGLALVERMERTDVVVGTGQSTRAYTLELRLRAEQVGTWEIGPIRVEHGASSAFSGVESVTVGNASSGGASGLDPDLMALLPRVPGPRAGRPSVFTLASDDRLFAGDQLNLLTGAWLPRGLRLRLRQAPTLTPPSLAGVFATARQPVTGAVASRQVDSETYDLYVSFQTAYPLNPGPLTVPPARLAWVQPTSRQYLGAERRESVESAPVRLNVRPLPDAGRPGGFDGPVARDLRISYELGASSARAGAALRVSLVVAGAGNLPLWPVPKVDWPASVRVYQEGTEGGPRLVGARMGGVKKFKFGIVPDSAGSLSLPPLDYPYFDPGSASYRSARAPAIVIPVLEAAPVADRRSPLPILEPLAQPFAERVVRLPRETLLALAGTPLLLMGLAALWRRRRPRVRAPVAQPDPEARLRAVLQSLVPPGTPAAAPALMGALRQAGVERAEAERLVALHLAVEAERFGPPGGGARSPAPQEIDAVLRALPLRLRRAGGLALLCVAAVLPSRGAAQSGLELYANGDYAAAARAFRAEAETAPLTATRWYDLAAAEYLAHHDAEAVAALLPARAHAPRDPYIKALWGALAREHEQLRRAGRQWPLSAEEAFVLALLALWLGAALFLVLPRARPVWIPLLSLAALAAAVGLTLRTQRGGALAVTAGNVSLRTSPHGLAPERGSVPGFSIVELDRTEAGGAWWLVRTRDGGAGWVPAEILARSPALD